MHPARAILVAQPDRPQSRLSFMFMKQAVAKLAVLASVPNLALEEIYEAVERADLVVVDATESSPTALYVLGYAHAKNKPVLVLYESTEQVPFDVTDVRSLSYSPDNLGDAFVDAFRLMVQEALSSPAQFQGKLKTAPRGTSVFISYNHKDAQFLERIRVHMRPLEKAQRIELWDDTKIMAGQQWKPEINAALNRAKAAVLLISADFIASDFIVDNELPTLLKKAQSEGTLIIPVILKTSRFLRDARLNTFQAINDPLKPLAELSEIEQEKIYDKICLRIESWLPVAIATP